VQEIWSTYWKNFHKSFVGKIHMGYEY